MSMKLTEYGAIAEVIARAIGTNDPYPNKVQLAAHRAKQVLKEKQFPITESKGVNE